MRLNIGCGARILPDWINIDVQGKPDIIAAAHAIPLADGVAHTIMAVHLWEHFYRWECDVVIEEWRRLLRPEGTLILELPNLLKCAQNLIEGVHGKAEGQLNMWGIYGDPRNGDPYMCHRWGWTPDSLKAFLKSYGFVRICEAPTQYHPVGRTVRDMRFECLKS